MAQLQRRRRVVGQNVPPVDDADAVGAVHLLDVMGGDDDGELALLTQPANVAPQPVTRLRIQADGRFIEKQDACVVHEGAGDLQPALHARGERPHQCSAPFREFDELEHLLDPAPPLRRRDAIDEPVEIEVLVQGQAIVEARLLEDDAEAAPARQSDS